MRLRPVVTALLTLAGGSPAMAQLATPPRLSVADSARIVDDIRESERRLQRAFLRADTAQLAALHADGFVLTNIKAEAGSKSGRLRLIGSGGYRFRRFDVDEQVVNVFASNVAVVTERIRYSGTLGGHDVEFVMYRVTNVWVARDGRWELAATQGTLVPPP